MNKPDDTRLDSSTMHGIAEELGDLASDLERNVKQCHAKHSNLHVPCWVGSTLTDFKSQDIKLAMSTINK